ncbi:MAG TPA: DNA gyrase C-terminal beta-propeller domain-containing protein, partial [Microvirga sp.]|nr:DNA gyrase C-terminal beta-propeller domain-containing protein [Microvirga sp.]
AKLLVVGSDGRGFIVPTDDTVANTRKGKGVLTVDAPARAVVCTEAEGTHIAIIGENRKLLIFPAKQVPEMTRGKGVRLQRYKDGGVSDAKVFKLKEGLTWKDTAGRTWTVAKEDLRDWVANRAEAGRLPPKGFPKSNKFGE